MIRNRMKEFILKVHHWLRLNTLYLGSPPWDSGISPPELIEFIEQSKPGRALDLGCGTGTNLLTLARAGWQVEGVEFALLAYHKAWLNLKALGKGHNIYLADVVEIGFLKHTYDLILDIGCYHGLGKKDREKYHKNVQRLISPGGTFLLYGFLLNQYSQAGIEEAEIDAFSQAFKLVSRQEGTDHGRRPSVWLRFENKQ